MQDLAQIVDTIRRIAAPALRQHRGEPTPWPLQCSIEPVVDWATTDLDAAVHGRLPDDLVRLWQLCGGMRLFVDARYSQWGLVVSSPTTAATTTIEERAARPEQYQDGDMVLGKFLGDSERLLLRCAPEEPDFGRVMIALPIDPRSEWYVAAESLTHFFERYVFGQGDKFWESR